LLLLVVGCWLLVVGCWLNLNLYGFLAKGMIRNYITYFLVAAKKPEKGRMTKIRIVF
jgi:hypothetical protein